MQEGSCTSRTLPKRPSQEQKEALIDWLERHLDVANDKFIGVDGVHQRDEMWGSVASQLNSLGGARKDRAKWRKFWMDLRSYTKNKKAELRQAEERSGVNGTRRAKPLTAIEERIVTLITPVAIFGMTAVPELGLTTGDEDVGEISFAMSENAANEDEANVVEQSASKQPIRRKRKQTQGRTAVDNYSKILKIEEAKLEVEKLKLEEEKKKTAIFENMLIELKEIKSMLSTK